MPSRQKSKKSSKRSNKQNRKGKSKSRKSNKLSKRQQRGGTSTACVLDYANKNNMYNVGANIHNTNPQASLDLDGKFVAYGGPLPLGSSIVGGGSCGSEGVGTSNPKSETFKEYMSKLDENLSSVTKGGGEHKKPEPNSQPHSQPNVHPNVSGGGFSSDPADFVAGNPVIKGYDDNSPPAIIGGQLVFGSPDQPVCGNGAVGGFRRSKKNKKHNKKSSKSKKSKRSKRKNMKHSKQRGGDFTTFNKTKPAGYDTAFNGPAGVFKYPDNMMERTFTGKQPVWSVTDV